jgi:hypothetical protein
VCSVLGVDQEKVELYYNYVSCGNKLENLDVTLEHAGLQMDQEIRLAQKKLELSPWPSSNSGMHSTGNNMVVIALEPPYITSLYSCHHPQHGCHSTLHSVKSVQVKREN